MPLRLVYVVQLQPYHDNGTLLGVFETPEEAFACGVAANADAKRDGPAFIEVCPLGACAVEPETITHYGDMYGMVEVAVAVPNPRITWRDPEDYEPDRTGASRAVVLAKVAEVVAAWRSANPES